jgi:hypothetical protein
VRLPDALGEPHPARTHAEVRLEERREPLDLAELVVVGQHGQDRLVESTGQELHLAACGEGPEEIEAARRALAQPLEQAAGAVDAQPDLGALVGRSRKAGRRSVASTITWSKLPIGWWLWNARDRTPGDPSG